MRTEPAHDRRAEKASGTSTYLEVRLAEADRFGLARQ